MTLFCKFLINARPRLFAPRETAPLVSAYLSDDVRADRSIASEFAASDSYVSRISEGRSMKTCWRTRIVHGPSSTTNGMYDADNVVFVAQLALNSDRPVSPDAAICIQIFCEVSCTDDSEWGLHTCGWACARLVDLVHSHNHTVAVPLCDQGRSPTGARGLVTVHVNNGPTLTALQRLKFADGIAVDLVRESRGRLYPDPALQQYAMQVYSAVDDESHIIDDAIRLRHQPHYASCGGCLIRPSCAFLLAKNMPNTKEDYYVAALTTVMARRFRHTTPPLRAGANFMFLNGLLGANEQGAILMDVAMLASTACTYLFDEVLNPPGKQLTGGEDYCRNLSLMYTNDCEDFAFNALVALWELLVRNWTSPGIRRLQTIRKNYVATIVLKAVTRTSWSDDAANALSGRGLAAHNCCDLIPLRQLVRLLPSGAQRERGVLTDLIHRREKWLLPPEQTLSVIVGEGTVRLVQHTREGVDPAAMPAQTRRLAATLFDVPSIGAAAPVTACRDNGGTFKFFRATIMSIVHDTLIDSPGRPMSEWPLCYIKWMSGTHTLAVEHDSYVRMNEVQIQAVPFMEPPQTLLKLMYTLEKFEHPLQPLLLSGTFDESAFNERSTAVMAMIARTNARLAKKSNGGNFLGASSTVRVAPAIGEIYVPLWALDDIALQRLEDRFLSGSSVTHITVAFERIADALISAVFNIQF